MPTAIPAVKIFEPRVFGDERGFFFESWNARTFSELGLQEIFVQDNHSRSAKGVLRGLHFQVSHPQGKLVRVVAGSAFDVAVDLRRSSPHFGRWVGLELSAENRRLLWIPPGFAHGFLSLRDGTEFLYKCTDFYQPTDERSLIWNDPAVGIAWPLETSGPPCLSAKDEKGLPLSAIEGYP
jgi:dTDP-4-dehydrorhamnose 3,5-epimerase